MNLSVNLANIPPLLTQYPNFVHWRLEKRGDKETKPPFVAGVNCKAASDDPRTWCDFATASARLNGDDRGLGFVCSPRPGIAFVDLDHVRDASKWLYPWAERLVQRVASYAEFSPSGTGVHIYARWRAPGTRGLKLGSAEIYSRRRFFTLTGDRVPGAPADITDADLSWLYRLIAGRVFPPAPDPQKPKPPEKYDVLFNRGDWNSLDYPSQSEADQALCYMLACKRCNAEDIDNAFRLSALYREKWERSDYREPTISKALDSAKGLTPERTSAPRTAAVTEDQDWRARLLLGKAGKIRPFLANLREILRNHPQCKSVLAFDEFAQKVWLLKEPPWGGTAQREWSNDDDHKAVCWLQQDVGICANLAQIVADAVSTTAREKGFHPVRNYLNGLAWDGTARAESWLTTYLGAMATDYTRAVGPRWLRSAIARVFRPGCQADYVLLLQGEQGILKSTALRILAGEWFCAHVDGDMGDKDSRACLRGMWIVEWGEMAHVRQQEWLRTKNYLTTRIDHYRPAYARHAESYARQCVFAASTNKDEPLQDLTGNRRFWPVTCGRIELEALKRDRDQLWAEVVTEYRAGAKWWLETPALNAMAEAEQDERLEQYAYTDLVLDWCENPTRRERYDKETQRFTPVEPWNGSQANQVSVQDILRHCLERPTATDAVSVPEVLKKAGWRKKQIRVGDRKADRRRRYYVREKPDAKPFGSDL